LEAASAGSAGSKTEVVISLPLFDAAQQTTRKQKRRSVSGVFAFLEKETRLASDLRVVEIKGF
jgi:hypothetical protein